MTKVTEIIIVRHGEAEHNKKGTHGGWANSDLTPKGIMQAERAKAYLDKHLEGNYTYYASDLNRARHTAKIVAGDQPIRYDWRIREIYNGLAAVMDDDERKAHLKPYTQPAHTWQAYPCAEDWGLFHERVCDFMEDVHEERVVIVTHGGTAANIVLWWLGLTKEHLGKIFFDIDNGSVTKLCYNEWRERHIAYLNRRP